MDRYRFAVSPVGRVIDIDVPASGGILRLPAFVPAPLPDDFQLASSTWNAVVEAARHLGSLDSLARDQLGLGVSPPTAYSALKRLVEHGILEEVTGGSYGRVYQSPGDRRDTRPPLKLRTPCSEMRATRPGGQPEHGEVLALDWASVAVGQRPSAVMSATEMPSGRV